MKKSGAILAVIILFLATSTGYAQLREQQSNSADYSGPVIREQVRKPGNWSDLFNMKMSHSYSMSFAAFGGNTYNINAYTNTMQFFFSEKLTGRVDLSVLHSPFGNNLISGADNNLGAKFIIRNAELNYQIGEKSNLRIQFQQLPTYGLSPYSPFNRSPYGHFYYY